MLSEHNQSFLECLGEISIVLKPLKNEKLPLSLHWFQSHFVVNGLKIDNVKVISIDFSLNIIPASSVSEANYNPQKDSRKAKQNR